MGAVLGVVVGVVGVIDTQDWSLLMAPLVLAVVVGVPLGLLHAMTWLLWPCRVSYVVADGHFVASRGSRVIKRFRVEDVVSIQVGDEDQGLNWVTLIFSGWFSYYGPLPGSGITIGQRGRWDANAGEHDLPKILLWGDENWRRANSALASGLPSTRGR